MSRLTRLLTTAALLLAALGSIGANGGLPPESGCFDLKGGDTAGSANYLANWTGTENDDAKDPLGIFDFDDTPTYAGGTVYGSVVLDGDACPRADYTVAAYENYVPESTAPALSGQTLTGRASELKFNFTTPDAYGEACVDLVARVSVRGVTIDESVADNVCGGTGGRTWGG